MSASAVRPGTRSVPGLIAVLVAAGLSVASATASKPPPEGYVETARDPRGGISLERPHIFLYGSDNGRARSVHQKRLVYWVEQEFARAGVPVVREGTEADFAVFVTQELDSKELDVTRNRPHSAFQYNSDGTWSSTQVEESYSETETYVVRRIYIDVYNVRNQEPVWQGYLGVSAEEFSRCPEAWVRALAAAYPGDLPGEHRPLKQACNDQKK